MACHEYRVHLHEGTEELEGRGNDPEVCVSRALGDECLQPPRRWTRLEHKPPPLAPRPNVAAAATAFNSEELQEAVKSLGAGGPVRHAGLVCEFVHLARTE